MLSFPLEEAGEVPVGSSLDGDAPPPRLLGDVVVCARQALRQARADGLPPAFELSLLVVHGVLHLLGHDHEVDAGQMALRQAELLEHGRLGVRPCLRRRNLLNSFNWAFEGIVHALRRERNMQIHFAIAGARAGWRRCSSR